MKKVTEILENGTNIIYRSNLDENVTSQLLQGIIVGNDEENSEKDLSNLNYYILRGTDRFAKGEQGVYDEMIHYKQIVTTYEPKDESLSEDKLQEAIETEEIYDEIEVLDDIDEIQEDNNYNLLKEKAEEFKCSKCKTVGKNIIVPSIAINGQYYVMCEECGNIRVAKEALSNEGVTFVLNETPEKLTTPAHHLLVKDAKDSFTAMGIGPDRIFMTKEELDKFKLKEEIKYEIIEEIMDDLMDRSRDYIDSQILCPGYNEITYHEDDEVEMQVSNLEISDNTRSDYVLLQVSEDGVKISELFNVNIDKLKKCAREAKEEGDELLIYEISNIINAEELLK